MRKTKFTRREFLKAGMKPASIDEIEIRGETIENVQRNFVKPNIYTWESIRNIWGFKEI